MFWWQKNERPFKNSLATSHLSDKVGDVSREKLGTFIRHLLSVIWDLDSRNHDVWFRILGNGQLHKKIKCKKSRTDYFWHATFTDCDYTVHFYGAMFREGDVWICMEVNRKQNFLNNECSVIRYRYFITERKFPVSWLIKQGLCSLFKKSTCRIRNTDCNKQYFCDNPHPF